MRRLIIVCIIGLLLLTQSLKAQISIGGKPQKIEINDNQSAKTVKMPDFVIQKSLLKSSHKNDNKLKPLKFAHAFEVNLSPLNSGVWVDKNNNISIWQLNIVSENALSINLILDQFKLPNRAKLFVFNEDEEQYLGAFTSQNNKESEKFAIAPVKGEKITIQYEVATNLKHQLPFVITKVNHDYVGILDLPNPRRPLDGAAADYCNIDVNCFNDSTIQNLRDACCRIIVDGQEICSGTLMNNTAEDGKPYVLSAAHCYDKWKYAETSIYTFNYQSPSCQSVDGDTYQAISGAQMVAKFDSIDFALTELSVTPPPQFHPFYAGWDRQTNLTTSTLSIHHPKGDIKKIAIDNDVPTISSFYFAYLSKGFWKIGDWEEGVTEAGSSGAGLFNNSKRLIGSLTGGDADCWYPQNDYYARFNLAWDYRSEDSLQLAKWLDPQNTGKQYLEGIRFYTKEEQCLSFTNLQASDSLQTVYIDENNTAQGFWGGNNEENITEFAERFSVPNTALLNGVSIGIEKIKSYHFLNPSTVKLKIYNGTDLPNEEIYSKTISINSLTEKAMNFIEIDSAIAIPDTFFVGLELFNITAPDTVILMQSINKSDKNHFYFKKDNNWNDYAEYAPQQKITSAFEVLCCNLSTNRTLPIQNHQNNNLIVYPNPTFNGKISLKINHADKILSIKISDILGRLVDVPIQSEANNVKTISLTHKTPGIYFITVRTDKGVYNQKISYAP